MTSTDLRCGDMLKMLPPGRSINEITDEELRRMHIVRLHDPVTRTSVIVSSKNYGELYAHCVAVRRSCEGYLFAHDLNRIRGLMRRENVISHEELFDVSTRAETLREDGIPPIFTEEWCGRTIFNYTVHDASGEHEVSFENLFPTIDFLIQYGAGIYERKHAAMAAALWQPKCKRSKIPITPTSSRDVRLFRTRAFTPEGKIDPLLIMEILEYVATHFQFKSKTRCETIQEFDLLAFTFLESELKDLPCEQLAYEAWDGDPLIVQERRWYLPFAPESRIRIVQTYLDTLKGALRGRDAETFRFLEKTFPQQTVGMRQKLNMRQKQAEKATLDAWIENAFANNNFRCPPDGLLLLPEWSTELLPRIGERFRSACRLLDEQQPGALFESIQELAARLKLPTRLAYLPEFKRILDEARFASARRLRDEQFRQIFTSAGKFSFLGRSKFRKESPVAHELRAYISARYRSLKTA